MYVYRSTLKFTLLSDFNAKFSASLAKSASLSIADVETDEDGVDLKKCIK